MSKYVRDKQAAARVDVFPYKNAPRGSLPKDGCLVSHQMGRCCCAQDGATSCVFERLPNGTWQRRAGVVTFTSLLFDAEEHVARRVGSAIDAVALCGCAVPASAVYWMVGSDKEPRLCPGCVAAMDALAKG